MKTQGGLRNNNISSSDGLSRHGKEKQSGTIKGHSKDSENSKYVLIAGNFKNSYILLNITNMELEEVDRTLYTDYVNKDKITTKINMGYVPINRQICEYNYNEIKSGKILVYLLENTYDSLKRARNLTESTFLLLRNTQVTKKTIKAHDVNSFLTGVTNNQEYTSGVINTRVMWLITEDKPIPHYKYIKGYVKETTHEIHTRDIKTGVVHRKPL